MTKEELEKDATEYAQKLGVKDFIARPKEIVAYFGYLAGAEPREKRIAELEKENAELRAIAEFQQSSNMSRHFENKKLKEGLAVGSTFNKALNSMNKSLEEERDKYRNMVFDLQKENAELKGEANSVLDNWCRGDDPCPHLKKRDDQLTLAKELLNQWLQIAHKNNTRCYGFVKDTEQFLEEK